MSSTKPPTSVVPAAKADDITTALNNPPPVVPVAQPGDIRVESMPDMIDEMAMEDGFRAYSKFVQEIGRDVSKRWYGMPPRYAPPHFVYFRCGVKGDPRAEFLRGQLRDAGWVDAPAGTSCTIYLLDRGNGLYMCTRADIYKRFHDLENRMIREKNERALKSRQREGIEHLREQGIEVDNIEARTEQMTAEEFMGGKSGVSRQSGFTSK